MDMVAEINRLSGEALALCYRSAAGYLAHLGRHSALILSGEAYADLNCMLIGPESDPVRTLRESMAIVRDRSIPVIGLFTPHVMPLLAEEASRQGLSHAGEFPIMVLEAGATCAVSADFKVSRVLDGAALQQAGELQAASFAIAADAWMRTFGVELLDGPGVEVFIGYKGSIPMSAVQTVRTGSALSIWGMGTSPAYQRQGAGKALLGQIINDFTARGVKRFYLGASPAGRALYESLGFKHLAAWSVWILGKSVQVS